MEESRQVDRLKNKEKWLKAHRKYGIVTASCRASKISRATVYKWLSDDPEFVKAKEEAEKEAIELLEGEARRRAYEGTLKPVYFKGEQCGEIREYSDTLMMFILKAKKSEYRDRVTTEMVTPPGGIDINVHNLTPEERRLRIDELIAKGGIRASSSFRTGGDGAAGDG